MNWNPTPRRPLTSRDRVEMAPRRSRPDVRAVTEPVLVDDYGKTPCQCRIVTIPRDAILFCPTHAHAFALLDYLRRYVAASSNVGPYPKEARALLRAVEEASNA